MALDQGNKFKNSMGTYLLKGLFFEENVSDRAQVLYTLKDYDHPNGYPSLYRLYIAVSDPTEYRFANQYLDGFPHWEMLTRCSWFQPYLARWRRELALKIRSDALAEIIETGKKPSKDQLAANRFLLVGGWDQELPTKGRPSKEAIKKAAFDIASDKEALAEDYARVMN